MRAKTRVLVFVAAVFVLATILEGYAAQMTSDQQRTYEQKQSGNNPNSNSELAALVEGQESTTNEVPQAQRPTPLRPVIIRQIGWSWLLISGLIGFLLGRLTTSRRRAYRRDEDIRRDRAA